MQVGRSFALLPLLFVALGCGDATSNQGSGYGGVDKAAGGASGAAGCGGASGAAGCGGAASGGASSVPDAGSGGSDGAGPIDASIDAATDTTDAAPDERDGPGTEGAPSDAGRPENDADRRDASRDAAPEGASPGNDGPPNRMPCTSTFGSALSQAFGRLDGYLVALIVPGQATCKPDNDHVYLQIVMKGATYQIAANVHSTQGGPNGSDVLYLEKALTAMPDGPWAEGWHTAQVAFDYVADAAVHATDFTSTPLSTLAARIENRLVNVNHISVFATGYGPDGAHLIHRNGSGHDGAVVTEPLSAAPHALMFHFADQTF